MEQVSRILIVEDDEVSIYLTKIILNDMFGGSEVQTALDGAEGLELLRIGLEKGKLPQLILLDINMQGMGGFTFLEELVERKYVNHIDTKIVLLSGSQTFSDIKIAKNHIIAFHLQKPLTRSKLLSVLD